MKPIKEPSSQPRVHRYAVLAETLRGQIRRGQLRPGDRLPSTEQLRKDYQVGTATIERVHVVLEREGLVVREPNRGVFVADTTLRPLLGVIGFAGSAFAELNKSLYWGRLLKALKESLALKQTELLVLNRPSATLWDRIDGLILCDLMEHSEPYLSAMPADMPCVSILLPAYKRSSITFDDVLGAELAVQHLARLGHKRIVCMMDMHNRYNPELLKQRYHGYEHGLQLAGIPFDPELVVDLETDILTEDESTETYYRQGKEITRRWFSENWRRLQPTAIMMQNDPAAMGSIDALQELGLRVPDQVSVIGYDGAETFDFNKLPLSTIEVPLHEIGVHAVGMLFKQIAAYRDGLPIPLEEVTLPVKLREGGSTSQPKLIPMML